MAMKVDAFNSDEWHAIARLAAEPPARARVVVSRGAPRLLVNDTDVFPLAAWSWSLEGSAYHFKRAGIRILHPLLGLNVVWPDPDTLDWSLFARHFDRLLTIHPDALFLPRLHLDPPPWWIESYPDELVRTAIPPVPKNPRQYRDVRINPEGGFEWGIPLKAPSPASEIWRRDMSRILVATVEAIKDSPLASRVIGYQIGAGIYGEWHYPLAEFMPDTSGPAAAKYGQPPDAEARLLAEHGLFRDPVKQRSTIEYYKKLHAVGITDSLLHFASLVKGATDRQVVVGSFFAYLLENPWIQDGGHLAPERVLDSPDIDFIACPYSYQTTNRPDRPWWEHDVVDDSGNFLGRARGVGGDGGYRVLLESLRRHGKLYFVEIDPSTYLEPPPQPEGGSEIERELPLLGGVGSTTPTGTRNILRHDLGRLIASGCGGWLFDFGPVLATGNSWYADEPIIESVRPFNILGAARANMDLTSVSQVAAVYQPEAFFYTKHWLAEAPFRKGMANMDFFCAWFLDTQARSLHRLGAPIDFLYEFDLKPDDLTRYKVVFAFNSFVWTDERVAAFRKMLSGSGTTIVWMYAPGFVSDDGLEVERMRSLTGLNIDVQRSPGSFLIDIEPHLRDSVEHRFGVDTERHPRFSISDPKAEVLGRWQDNGTPALARKEMDGWTSVYAGTGPIPVRLLRHLVRRAGCPIWSSEPDQIVALEDVVMLTASTQGHRTIVLPKPMVSLETGATAARFHFTLDEGEVRFFTGEPVTGYME